MRVVVCALAKNENLYINEWVGHYLKLGFDHIYLYDNNELTTPFVGDFIDSEYKDRVTIKNIRGMVREKLQHDIYTGFYQKYGKTFDWCLFCDIDEFLMGVDNIHDFLNRNKNYFNNFEQIRIKWKLFGDDNLIERPMKEPIYKEIVQQVTSSLNRDLIHKGNLENQGKAIVRGGLNGVVIKSPHFASRWARQNILKSCLPSGMACYRSGVAIEDDYSKESVFLNHYMTKTLSEFINQKIGRSDAVFGNTINLDYYWRINKKTKEKIEYLEKLGFKL